MSQSSEDGKNQERSEYINRLMRYGAQTSTQQQKISHIIDMLYFKFDNLCIKHRIQKKFVNVFFGLFKYFKDNIYNFMKTSGLGMMDCVGVFEEFEKRIQYVFSNFNDALKIWQETVKKDVNNSRQIPEDEVNIPFLQYCLRILFNSFKDFNFQEKTIDLQFLVQSKIKFEYKESSSFDSDEYGILTAQINGNPLIVDQFIVQLNNKNVEIEPKKYILQQNKLQKKGESWSIRDQYIRSIEDLNLLNPFAPIIGIICKEGGNQMPVEYQILRDFKQLWQEKKQESEIREQFQKEIKQQNVHRELWSILEVRLLNDKQEEVVYLSSQNFSLSASRPDLKTIIEMYAIFNPLFVKLSEKWNIQKRDLINLQDQLQQFHEIINIKSIGFQIFSRSNRISDKMIDIENLQQKVQEEITNCDNINKQETRREDAFEAIMKKCRDVINEISEKANEVLNQKQVIIGEIIKEWSEQPFRILDLRQNIGYESQLNKTIYEGLCGFNSEQCKQTIFDGKFKREGITVVLVDHTCKQQCGNIITLLDKLPNVIKVGASVPPNTSMPGEKFNTINIKYEGKEIYNTTVGVYGVNNDYNKFRHLINNANEPDVYSHYDYNKILLNPKLLSQFMERMMDIKNEKMDMYANIKINDILGWYKKP